MNSENPEQNGKVSNVIKGYIFKFHRVASDS